MSESLLHCPAGFPAHHVDGRTSAASDSSDNIPTFTPAELGFGERAPRATDPHKALADAKDEDARDAAADGSAFALKVRRAHRLSLLKQDRVHRRLKVTWVAFCDTHFAPGGYDTWVRYRAAEKALLQLWHWDLPLPGNAETVRVIVPVLRVAGGRSCLTKLVETHKGYPARHELLAALSQLGRPRTRKPTPPTVSALIRFLAALEQCASRFHAAEVSAFRDARLRLEARRSEAALKSDPLFRDAKKGD